MHENFKDQSDMEITSFGAKHSEFECKRVSQR